MEWEAILSIRLAATGCMVDFQDMEWDMEWAMEVDSGAKFAVR